MRAVESLPSGKYKVRFRNGLNKKGTGPRQSSEIFTSKKQAEDFAKRLDLLGVDAALDWLYAPPDAPPVPTLEEVAQDHFDNLLGVEKGTEDTYRRLWKRTWGPTLGHLPVDEINEDAIGKVFKELGTKYSLKSLKNQRALLSGVFGRAIKKKHIAASPMKEIKRLPAGQMSKINREMRIITVEEFAQLEEDTEEHYKTFVRFLWATGARWGEATALQPEDLRWPNITIQRAWKYAPKREDMRLGPPKNRKSRTITLPDDIKDEMIALAASKEPGELLFTTPGGARLHHRHFWEHVWKPATESIQGQKPGPHDLRHSHASHLLANGVPIHVVSDRLGHSSIKITVDTYGHLQPDMMKWAAQAAQLGFKATPKELPSGKSR